MHKFEIHIQELRSRYASMTYEDGPNAKLQSEIDSLHIRITEIKELIRQAELDLSIEIENRRKREHNADAEARAKIDEEERVILQRYHVFDTQLDEEIAKFAKHEHDENIRLSMSQ